MLERTKKRRTDKIVVLTFQGPRIEASSCGRISFPPGIHGHHREHSMARGFTRDERRGFAGRVCLRGARLREDLTQVELARKTGIPQRHISEMENGKRTIGTKNAQIFADVLNRWLQGFFVKANLNFGA